jgi:CO/xanthine dehydrogenase Mo-binding subunit
MPEGDGDRNGIPLYTLPNAKVVFHYIPEMPIRTSALRGLGAYMNVFTIESFMDELAHAAGADPVEFRLRHLQDPRAQDVVRLAAEKFGWSSRKPGSGFAFARYKNLGAYCAVALETELNRSTGAVRVRRAVLAVDSGQAVNPDGIRNQIEGGFLQSSSWTLFEQVTWNASQITSRDWASYPILRYGMVPDSVETHIINRPGAPFLGTGEASQGPTPAAIANAIFDATSVRLRDLPFNAKRVKESIGV